MQDRGDTLLGLALPLSAPVVFGAFMVVAPLLSGHGEFLILVPMLWPSFAAFFGFSLLARGFGLELPELVAAAAYIVFGFAYLVARSDHQMQGAAVPLLWPFLLLWQDVCRLGFWGCPAG